MEKQKSVEPPERIWIDNAEAKDAGVCDDAAIATGCMTEYVRADTRAGSTDDENGNAFQWLTDTVPGWWKATEDVSVDVSTGTAYYAGIRLAHRGDYILNIDGKLFGCPEKVFRFLTAARHPAAEPSSSAADMKAAMIAKVRDIKNLHRSQIAIVVAELEQVEPDQK